MWRLSGLALLIGSVVYLIGKVISIAVGESPLFALFMLVGVILVVMGLPGFYVRQAAKAGILGLIGWILFLCSALLGIGGFTSFLVFVPSFPATATAGPPPAARIEGIKVHFFP